MKYFVCRCILHFLNLKYNTSLLHDVQYYTLPEINQASCDRDFDFQLLVYRVIDFKY